VLAPETCIENLLTVIDFIQKLTNQQGQKWQLFFHLRFSVIIFSVLLQHSKNDKMNLLGIQAHTFSLLEQHRK
jgi:hypothetical protein